MVITISLPDEIQACLRRQAEAQRRPIEELAADILTTALGEDAPPPTPEEVVAKIRATATNPHSIRPATGSLAEALRSAPTDPEFDLAAWTRDWAMVEVEMRRMTCVNDTAEGRG